jgi:hypothetical protein
MRPITHGLSAAIRRGVMPSVKRDADVAAPKLIYRNL